MPADRAGQRRDAARAGRSAVGDRDAPGEQGAGNAASAETAEGGDTLQERSGLDLVGDVPAAADWLAGIGGPLVLGNYVYADGAANVRVSAAVDALTVRLRPRGTTWRSPSWPRRPTCSR